LDDDDDDDDDDDILPNDDLPNMDLRAWKWIEVPLSTGFITAYSKVCVTWFWIPMLLYNKVSQFSSNNTG
jgi:hypothetical protein